MKIKLFLLLFLVPQFIFAQSSEQQVFDNIAKAFQTNQTQDLAPYFASSLECDILGQNKVYSKAQASAVIKDFVTQNKAKSFTVLHQSGKSQVKFIIGTYIALNGKTFRLTCFLKSDNGGFLVHQIRIEDELKSAAL